MGMAAILVMSWTSYLNFCSHFPRRIHMKFGFDLPIGFRGEDDGQRRRRRHRRTPEHGYTMSSTFEPDGSHELKSAQQIPAGKFIEGILSYSCNIFYFFAFYYGWLNHTSYNALHTGRNFCHEFVHNSRCCP